MANLPDARTWTVDNLVVTTLLTLGPGAVSNGATGTTLSLAGPITLTAAASQIIPGATSFSIRNNANNVDNLLISNGGDVTIRSNLTVGNTLQFSTAASQIVPGATSFSIRNNAQSADNL